jgi:hypothetical protein
MPHAASPRRGWAARRFGYTQLRIAMNVRAMPVDILSLEWPTAPMGGLPRRQATLVRLHRQGSLAHAPRAVVRDARRPRRRARPIG